MAFKNIPPFEEENWNKIGENRDKIGVNLGRKKKMGKNKSGKKWGK